MASSYILFIAALIGSIAIAHRVTGTTKQEAMVSLLNQHEQKITSH